MTHTVEIEGFGPVTFKPLGKVEMTRLRDAAKRGKVPNERPADTAALNKLPPRQARRHRENALLLSYVTDPKLPDEEVAEVFVGREHLAEEIAQAIRERSWPNR